MLKISEIVALSTISRVVKKFLEYSDKNILTHREIIINGFQNFIYFCSEIITARRNVIAKKLEVKYNKFFNKNNNYSFHRDFNIKIRNELNEDVSKDIIELKGQAKVLPIYKFTEAQGSHFIVEAEGPFRENYNDLYFYHVEKEPYLLNEGKDIFYRLVLTFYSKRYPCKDVQYLRIPVQVKFPLLFFVPDVFDTRYIRLIGFIKARKHLGRKLERHKKTVRQIYNIDIDKFEIAVLQLYRELSIYLEDNFKYHFSIKSDLEATLSSIKVSFASVFSGIPKPIIEEIITVDYKVGNKNTFYIDLLLNKEKFIKKSQRMWEKLLTKLPPELKK